MINTKTPRPATSISPSVDQNGVPNSHSRTCRSYGPLACTVARTVVLSGGTFDNGLFFNEVDRGPWRQSHPHGVVVAVSMGSLLPAGTVRPTVGLSLM